MTNYATPQQFSRAGKILRKLMYKNTLPQEEKPRNLPYFNYSGGGSEPSIGVEGRKMVYIQIQSYMIRPGDIEKIRGLEEVKERDEIYLTEDGFQMYVNTPEMSDKE